TCSTGSEIPEYFVANAGMLYFFGTSTRAISSTNGEAWNPVFGSTSTGTAAPGNFANNANIFWYVQRVFIDRRVCGNTTGSISNIWWDCRMDSRISKRRDMPRNRLRNIVEGSKREHGWSLWHRWWTLR